MAFGYLVPKLRLGTPSAKLRFAPPSATPDGRRETEFREIGSQTEFGNQKTSEFSRDAERSALAAARRSASRRNAVILALILMSALSAQGFAQETQRVGPAKDGGFLVPKLALVSNILLMVAILMWRPRGLFPVGAG